MSRKLISLSEAAAFFRDNDRFLVLTHKRPDGDTAGSAAALVLILRAMGKTAYALINSELTPRYIPFLSPLYAPEGYEPETVVSTDVAATQLLPANAAEYIDHIDLAIDHHGTNSLETERLLLEAESAACGEIIFELAHELSQPLTVELADPLYAALSTDTGCFRYSNTTPRTHRIAADLMAAGCHASEMNQQYFELHTRGRVAIESAVMNDVRFFFEGAVAVAFVPQELVQSTGAEEDDMESLSSMPRNIEGVRAGITLYERSEGIKVSVRTDETADASAICQQIGGGGHARAAGGTIANTPDHRPTLEKACEIMLKAVRTVVKGL